MIGYELRRSGTGGVLFAGTTPEEVAATLKNELECEDSQLEFRDVITLTPIEITQEQIDNMPEFEGW